jgi:hypothetical protein
MLLYSDCCRIQKEEGRIGLKKEGYIGGQSEFFPSGNILHFVQAPLC